MGIIFDWEDPDTYEWSLSNKERPLSDFIGEAIGICLLTPFVVAIIYGARKFITFSFP